MIHSAGKGDSGGPLLCMDGDRRLLCGVAAFGTGQDFLRVSCLLEEKNTSQQVDDIN